MLFSLGQIEDNGQRIPDFEKVKELYNKNMHKLSQSTSPHLKKTPVSMNKTSTSIFSNISDKQNNKNQEKEMMEQLEYY